MRRLLLSAAGLVPLAAFMGCSHMGGMCDCDLQPTIPCPPYCHVAVVAPIPAPAPGPVKPVEPLKEAPKPKTDSPEPKPESEEN
jgi:hypothetical protein